MKAIDPRGIADSLGEMLQIPEGEIKVEVLPVEGGPGISEHSTADDPRKEQPQ